MTHGGVRLWLRIEGFTALVVALSFSARSSGEWGLFGLLFLVPDLSLAAYLVGRRAGAGAYNLVHSYSLPLGLLSLGTTVAGRLIPRALIWLAHISFDRLVGFGLQYSTAFGETHLGRIGRGRPSNQPG